ncbi:MAG: tetratricopeptide repeat protein [Desulfobacteraceae bacterium]|nr:tetratricopeptide repeat protein [Desulfobacteraceae bacterium]
MFFDFAVTDKDNGVKIILRRFCQFTTIVRALAAIVLIIAVTGCTHRASLSAPEQWKCDSQADTAFKGGQWEKSFRYHEALVNREPSNCLALYHLGYVVGRMGDRDKEIQYYRKALTCGYNLDDQLHFNLGMAYLDLNQTAKAQVLLKQAISISPKNPENHFGLGVIAVAEGNMVIAEKAFEKTLSLNNEHWDARLMLARLYLEQGRWKHMQDQLEKVMIAQPDNEVALELKTILQKRQAMEYDSN